MQTIETTPYRASRTALCAVMVSALLALGGVSCGQRGPLYLPESKPGVSDDAAANPQPGQPPQEQTGVDASAAPDGQDEDEDEATP